MADKATRGIGAPWRKLNIPNEGGEGSFVSVPGQMTPGLLSRGLIRASGPGDGPWRYKQRNLGCFVFLGKWKIKEHHLFSYPGREVICQKGLGGGKRAIGFRCKKCKNV